jgi:Rps23 Pro-64 3,4-dihydroxylase Tpa1-like proline 4-hydroxylase
LWLRGAAAVWRRQEYVPEFNSLIVFRVPRPHEVTKVTAKAPEKRFSIFGWYYRLQAALAYAKLVSSYQNSNYQP